MWFRIFIDIIFICYYYKGVLFGFFVVYRLYYSCYFCYFFIFDWDRVFFLILFRGFYECFYLEILVLILVIIGCK